MLPRACENKGIVTLLSVLFVGSAGILFATVLILLGLSASRTGLALEEGYIAKALADACAEEALQQVHDFNDFSGNGQLIFDGDKCNYTVSEGAGGTKMVYSVGIAGDFIRKLEIRINGVYPYINIVSWQEVADF